MTRKIDLNGATVFSDDCNIYDVYMLIIDEDEKSIDCSDANGFTIALIYYEDSESCGFINCDENGRLKGYAEELVKNGMLVI